MCTALAVAAAMMDTLEPTVEWISTNVHQTGLVKVGVIAQTPWEVLLAHARIHALATAMLVAAVPAKKEERAQALIQIHSHVLARLDLLEQLAENLKVRV